MFWVEDGCQLGLVVWCAYILYTKKVQMSCDVLINEQRTYQARWRQADIFILSWGSDVCKFFSSHRIDLPKNIIFMYYKERQQYFHVLQDRN
jgi:hypothetical protein